MTPLRKLQPFTLPLTVGGTRIDIAGLRRDGTGEPLLFLHGFGSTKEDYADVIHQHDLVDPSCQRSRYRSWCRSPPKCLTPNGSSATT